MKKLLLCLASTSLVTTSTSILAYSLIKEVKPSYESRQFNYKYDLSKIINNSTPEDNSGKFVCPSKTKCYIYDLQSNTPLESPVNPKYPNETIFDHLLRNMIDEIFQEAIKLKSNSFWVTSVDSSLGNKSEYGSPNNLQLTNIIMHKSINRDINNITKIDQFIRVEQDQNNIFYITVYADFEIIDGIKFENVKISTIEFFKPRTENAIKNEFNNAWTILYEIIIYINGEDEAPTNIKIPDHIDFQTKKQILNMLNDTKQNTYKYEIKEHIEDALNISLVDIDPFTNLYYAEYDENTKKYKHGNEIPGGFEIEEPYFYVAVTAKEYAVGTYYVLIENTKGLNPNPSI